METLLDKIKAIDTDKIEMVKIGKKHKIGVEEIFYSNHHVYTLIKNIYDYTTILYNIHRRNVKTGITDILVCDTPWETIIEDEYGFIEAISTDKKIGAILTDDKGFKIYDDLYMTKYNSDNTIVFEREMENGTAMSFLAKIDNKQDSILKVLDNEYQVVIKQDKGYYTQ